MWNPHKSRKFKHHESKILVDDPAHPKNPYFSSDRARQPLYFSIKSQSMNEEIIDYIASTKLISKHVGKAKLKRKTRKKSDLGQLSVMGEFTTEKTFFLVFEPQKYGDDKDADFNAQGNPYSAATASKGKQQFNWKFHKYIQINNDELLQCTCYARMTNGFTYLFGGYGKWLKLVHLNISL